jgi:PAS domain S-box-containing protein
MEGLAAPFHFAIEFLILAVAAGAAFEAIRSARHGAGPVAVVQAAGFASLVAAEVLHGTLAVSGDGALAAVTLRAVGFGFIAASMRPMPAAALPALFVAGGDARWAVLPGAFALMAAARAFASRREAPRGAGATMSAAFVCFAAGELALAAGGPGGGAALAASHGIRALGAVFLARWLWLSLVRSVRLRFVAIFVIGLVLCASVVAGALTQVIGHNLEQQEFGRLALAGNGLKNAVSQRVNEAERYAVAFAGTESIEGPMRRHDKQQLRNIARVTVGDLPITGVDIVAFFNARGEILASATERSRFLPPLDPLSTIALSGSDAVATVYDTHKFAAEVSSAGPTSIAAIGASAVLDTSAKGHNRFLGAVLFGYTLDQASLRELGIGGDADITVVKGGEVLASTYERTSTAQRLVDAAGRRAIRRVVEEEGRPLTAKARAEPDDIFASYAPITNEGSSKIAGVLVLSRPSGVLAASQRSINRTLFLITLAAAAVAAALAWLLSGRVTRPIRALTRAARQVRGGDLEVRARVEAPDEVGTLGAAFNDMAASLKRMTDDLRSSVAEEANLRARMEAIMQSMGDALVATSSSGTVVATNRAAEQMLGRAADDMVGNKLSDVLVGVNGDGMPLAELALSGNGAHVQATVESFDGRRVPVALTGAPLRDAAGETVGRVVVLRDMSREQEAERMKSEFLSNVSHELRTPLTPIKGYTEILRRKKFPRDKAEQFLDGILDSTKRLERIVEILVDFAAMEAGRLKPHIEPIDVRGFLGKVLEPWVARESRHRFVRKIPAGLPPLLGDERLLRKCLDELIDNAVKFSPNGGTIEISAEVQGSSSRRRAPGAVRILVRDQGIGIDPSQMGRLFQDFRQLDGSETRSFGGLGLGLSYARRVALSHRGDITATSEPGRGSTFTVVLPAAPALRAARPERRRGAKQPAKTKQPAKEPRRTRKVASATRTPAARKRVAAAKTTRRRRPVR